jgi:hypothetical protein
MSEPSRPFLIRVLNAHGARHTLPGEFWVDRTTPLGNPHKITRFCSRDEAIHLFKKDLWRVLKPWVDGKLTTHDLVAENSGPMLSYFIVLAQAAKNNNITLLCHCKPENCHGDVIQAAIEWAIREGKV